MWEALSSLALSVLPNLGREGDSPSLTRRLRLRWERNLPKVTQQSGLELRLLSPDSGSRAVSQLGTSVSSGGHVAMSGYMFGCYNTGRACYWHLGGAGGEAGGAAEHPTMHRTSRPGECQDCQGPELPLQWFSAWATQQTHLGDLTIPIPRLPPPPNHLHQVLWG